MDEKLPFMINDADNHFVEPMDMYERYIDPKQRDRAVRFVIDVYGGIRHQVKAIMCDNLAKFLRIAA